MTSAASSGGVRSRTFLTAAIICASGSLIACAISVLVTVMVRGRPASARLLGRITDSALLDTGGAGRNADDHFRLRAEGEAAADLVYQIAEHCLSNGVVGNYALTHWADDVDAGRFATDHAARLV